MVYYFLLIWILIKIGTWGGFLISMIERIKKFYYISNTMQIYLFEVSILGVDIWQQLERLGICLTNRQLCCDQEICIMTISDIDAASISNVNKRCKMRHKKAEFVWKRFYPSFSSSFTCLLPDMLFLLQVQSQIQFQLRNWFLQSHSKLGDIVYNECVSSSNYM